MNEIEVNDRVILTRTDTHRWKTITEIFAEWVGKEFSEGGVTYKVVIVDKERGQSDES